MLDYDKVEKLVTIPVLKGQGDTWNSSFLALGAIYGLFEQLEEIQALNQMCAGHFDWIKGLPPRIKSAFYLQEVHFRDIHAHGDTTPAEAELLRELLIGLTQ